MSQNANNVVALAAAAYPAMAACRGVLARNCRGIAYVTDCEPARLPGCPAKACPDVEAARAWARERLADAPRVPAGVS